MTARTRTDLVYYKVGYIAIRIDMAIKDMSIDDICNKGYVNGKILMVINIECYSLKFIMF